MLWDGVTLDLCLTVRGDVARPILARMIKPLVVAVALVVPFLATAPASAATGPHVHASTFCNAVYVVASRFPATPPGQRHDPDYGGDPNPAYSNWYKIVVNGRVAATSPHFGQRMTWVASLPRGAAYEIQIQTHAWTSSTKDPALRYAHVDC